MLLDELVASLLDVEFQEDFGASGLERQHEVTWSGEANLGDYRGQQ